MYGAVSIVDGFPGKTSTHGSFGWSSVWLLHGDGRVVLIETGPPSYSPLLVSRLAELGYQVGDVTDVLITHAHWDHLGNVSLFPLARRWIGATEYAWALSQKPEEPFITQPLLRAMESTEGLLHLIETEGEIFPGIWAHTVPGHTPGHLAYSADTALGTLIFAGDSAKNLHELQSLRIDSALDKTSGTTSLHKLHNLIRASNGYLVPGHDVLCEYLDGAWKRVTEQRAEFQFFHAADSTPLRISVTDSDPHVFSTGTDHG